MISLLLPILAYAEIHYKWKYFPSRLFMKRPEIIADIPFRINPDTSLPLLCIIKDANRFPTWLKDIEIDLEDEKGYKQSIKFNYDGQPITKRYWSEVINIELSDELQGRVKVNVRFSLSDENDKKYFVLNDNLKGLSPLKLEFVRGKNALPRIDGWHYGDFHIHTDFTDDKVEFGAPIDASARLSKSLGLDFFVVADHSYNLDNSMENPYENDSSIPRWKVSRDLIDNFDTEEGALPLPAEEVSCGNARGENVHLLVLNSPHFIPGSGDSEDDYPNMKPTLTITETLDLMGEDAVAIAAHPFDKPSIGQKLIFNRGSWSKKDLLDDRIAGLQILNGLPDDVFYKGLKVWKELLLEGRRKTIFAGNDAHGNFNTFRQIKIPFLTMHQHKNQLFGQVRTALNHNGIVQAKSLLEAIAAGRAQITTGPLSELILIDKNDKTYGVGDEAAAGEYNLKLKVVSSAEFGRLKNILIIIGDYAEKSETVSKELTEFETDYEYENRFNIGNLKAGYIRMEAYTIKNGKECFSLTNPIWIGSGG